MKPGNDLAVAGLRLLTRPAPGCFHVHQREILPLRGPLPPERMPGTSLQVLQTGFLFRHEELFSEDLAAPGPRAIGARKQPAIPDATQLRLEAP